MPSTSSFFTSSFLALVSSGLLGLAVSTADGFDWGGEAADEDYESPFADDADEPFEFDDPPGEPDEKDDDTPDPPSPDDDFDWGTESPEETETDPPDNDHESAPTGDASTPVGEDKSPDSPSNEAPHPESSPTDAESDADDPVLDTRAEARTLCDEAMGQLHKGDSDQAFEQLSAHWAFSPDEMTELQREVERTRAVVADRYGDALDYRRLREDTAGDVLVRFVYLERFERHGLRWRFTFYEGSSGWTLNDIFFDDEIEALLE